MSINRTSSLKQIPELSPPDNAEKKDNEKSIKKTDEFGANRNEHDSASSSHTLSKPTKEKDNKPAQANKLKQPVVRQKLSTRQRSISNPVIIRPVASSTASSTITSDHSPLSKAPIKPIKTVSKPLTDEQHTASDLADLLDKVHLRKSSRLDDDINWNQATLNLQRQYAKHADNKFRIDELILYLFGDDVKKSEAWKIARDICVKIKVAYFKARDISSSLNETREKEADGMLSILAANFAGAFFNISGTSSKLRLPDSLKFFLQAIDHRKVRLLLSNDKAIGMSHEQFLSYRKEWVAKILIDTLLVPLVQDEFFNTRGSLESDHAVSHIINALHNAFAVIAPDFLSESIAAAPEDVTELIKQRRATQFKPRSNPQKARATDDQSAQMKEVPFTRPVLGKTSSPNRQRRAQLSELLRQCIKQLAPENLSDEILTRIKSFNNHYALSDQPVAADILYQEWLKIAMVIDGKSKAIEILKANAILQKEASELSNDLLEIDIFTKLAAVETSGQKLVPHRATRLSSDKPFVPFTIVDRSGVTSKKSNSSKASSTSTTSTASTSTTKASIDTSKPITKPRRSPTSASLRGHYRSATSDVPASHETVKDILLTDKEKQTLIKAFPTLLLGCVEAAAYIKKGEIFGLKSQPVKAIAEVGRNRFEIPLESIPEALRRKITASENLSKNSTHISHAELLKIIVLTSVRTSTAGKNILKYRNQALTNAGAALDLQAINELPNLEQIKQKQISSFKPLAEKIAADIFGKALEDSGLPSDLITIWKEFDQKLQSWAQTSLQLSEKELDELRSDLGFDLLITRLIYPICIDTEDVSSSVYPIWFADAVRQSITALWPKWFADFKTSQAATIPSSSRSVTKEHPAETDTTKSQ